MSRTSRPPYLISPALASQKPAMSFAAVDFPEPEGPTIAVMVPGSVRKVTPWSTSVPSW